VNAPVPADKHVISEKDVEKHVTDPSEKHVTTLHEFTKLHDYKLVLENFLISSFGIQQKLFLSMGMSGDYRDAIACGSHYIRLGTAIFGPRK